jgi:hypothetical protein
MQLPHSSEAEPVHHIRIRAALYLYAGPSEPAVGPNGLEVQRTRCTAVVGLKQWTLTEEYVDAGDPAAQTPRAALARLLDAVRAHQIEALVVLGLDRLGRTAQEVIACLATLATAGVDVVSIREGFDTTTAHGTFALGVLLALSGLGEGVAPLAVPLPAAQPARVPPPPHARRKRLPYGYTQTAEGIVVDAAAAATIRWIFALRAAGAHAQEIALALRQGGTGRFPTSRIAAILADETLYRGEPLADGSTPYPPIL